MTLFLRRISVLSLIFFCFVLNRSWAHKHHHHETQAEVAPKNADTNPLRQVNEAYLRDVKPVFVKKCFDCHSSRTKFPWYHQIPGIKQWLDHDIAEGREHIDMSEDFPFQGHGSPLEDLSEISESIRDGSMPPFSYRLMHRGSALTSEEKDLVDSWVEGSKKLLEPAH